MLSTNCTDWVTERTCRSTSLTVTWPRTRTDNLFSLVQIKHSWETGEHKHTARSKRNTWRGLLIVKLSPLHDMSVEHDSVYSVTLWRAGGPEQTKVIFDVQHQTAYTWRVWHHDDSKLITRQQASSCCEDKGLAAICFCCSLNQKAQGRKGSHMKAPTCWESTELGGSTSHQRAWCTSRAENSSRGGLMCCWCLSLQVTVCVCVCIWDFFLFCLYVDRVCLAYQVRSLSPSYIVGG